MFNAPLSPPTRNLLFQTLALSCRPFAFFETLCLFADEILHFVRGFTSECTTKNLVGFHFHGYQVLVVRLSIINLNPPTYVEILLPQIFTNCLKSKTLNLSYLILKVVVFLSCSLWHRVPKHHT